MFKKSISAAALCLLLAGCEVPVIIAAEANDGKWGGKGQSMFEIEFPAVMIVQVDGLEEEVLKGPLLGHANGTARYTLTGPNWGTCEGAYTKEGLSTMTCANGFDVAIDIGERRSKMSGHYIVSGEEKGHAFRSILGWGKEADEAQLRALLAASNG
ncbi:hypothetical protein [Pseudothioclava arenosa]|uniref:Uncharacterized protein n=1 Tax=Pseudothioclava arenosa TaxID=1795308 RepID=A0A2A4CMA3_9RHOB|nr:hypothetical protein [Pseudothioclava arenosa]PCD75725.1 hypothetical protein CLN94_12505 [Pseudothioclava arenosa]